MPNFEDVEQLRKELQENLPNVVKVLNVLVEEGGIVVEAAKPLIDMYLSIFMESEALKKLRREFVQLELAKEFIKKGVSADKVADCVSVTMDGLDSL